jgi:hypothetical protein
MKTHIMFLNEAFPFFAILGACVEVFEGLETGFCGISRQFLNHLKNVINNSPKKVSWA